MDKNIFSGLEDLGLDDLDNMQLFGKKEEIKDVAKEKKDENPASHLYDQEVKCPVCESSFKARSVKSSSPRIQKRDSDFFIRYAVANPYFYDVWMCNVCGYAAMKSDFQKIRSHQIEAVQQKISRKWTGRTYPDVYDANVAIERYKLALLNSVVMEAKSSRKAMNCLKIAWMYRLQEDENNEQVFLKQAIEGFNDAYTNEDFPLYGMDRFTTMYLIGELNRRVGNIEEANIWFSRVITTPNTPQKIKDLARDQRDLIKESTASETEIDTEDESKEKKQGFFSRFFK